MIGNRFLEGLEAVERDAMLAALTVVELSEGEILIEQGAEVSRVHFPLSAQLGNITVKSDGQHLETSVIGKEGLSGLSPFMADRPCAWQVVCRLEGAALVGRSDELRALSDRLPRLRRRFLELTNYYQSQANQLAVCNVHHRTTRRLARWLLALQDLTERDRYPVTQERIADSLGVQRTSMVDAFTELKKAGAIRHMRGWLEVRDRKALRIQACSCYEQLREQADALGISPEFQ